MTMQTLTKRISNGFQTAKAAEISRANASNGFVFPSRLQPCVEGAAVQALAREQSLTKSKSSNDPNNVMAGLGPSTQARTPCARERYDRGGRESGTQLISLPRPARPLGGRLQPGHDSDHNPIARMLEERRFVSRKGAKPQRKFDPSGREAPVAYWNGACGAGENLCGFAPLRETIQQLREAAWVEDAHNAMI